MFQIVFCGSTRALSALRAACPCEDIRISPFWRTAAQKGDILLCAKPPATPWPLQFAVGVASAEDAATAALLKAQNIPLLTVGRTRFDTLTLSSRQKDRVAVCLQREIRTLNGQPIGPAEYPLRLPRPMADTPLLYAAATLLLCDREPLLLSGDPFFVCQTLSEGSN